MIQANTTVEVKIRVLLRIEKVYFFKLSGELYVCIFSIILLLFVIATEFVLSIQGLEILLFILNNVILLNLHMLLPQLSCTYQYYASGCEGTSNEIKSKMVKN